MMDKSEELINEEASQHWFLDIDWYQQNNRSLFTLAQHCLCYNCRERLEVSESNDSTPELLAAIKGCCSQDPDFITSRLPILESVFRLILANGNCPLELEELGNQLRERLGGDTYRTSPEMLSRLLDNDRYYGLRRVGG
ncbi:hypothetical protein ACFLW8_06145 [Chloroflexota bacterium]